MDINIVVNKTIGEKKLFDDILNNQWFYGCREVDADRSLWYKTVHGCVGFIEKYGTLFVMSLNSFDEYVTKYEEISGMGVTLTLEFGGSHD